LLLLFFDFFDWLQLRGGTASRDLKQKKKYY
jgi:hypothetical protein